MQVKVVLEHVPRSGNVIARLPRMPGCQGASERLALYRPGGRIPGDEISAIQEPGGTSTALRGRDYDQAHAVASVATIPHGPP